MTPLGIVTLVRPVHPKNATSPTLVTLLSVHAEYEPDPTARSVVIVTVPDPVGGTAAVLAAVTYPSMYCVVGLAVTAARSLCPTANPIDGVDVYEKIFMLLSIQAEYEPEPTAISVAIVTVAVLAAVIHPSMYCVVGLAVTAARSLCPTANPIDGVDVYEKIFMPPPIPIELLLVELVTPPPIPPPPIPIELLLVDSPCTPGAPEIVTLVRPVQL